jgi:hypothetical protein
MLVGGLFTTIAGGSRERIALLDSDGDLDPYFNPGANDGVYAITLQPDGTIFAGGDFTMINGLSQERIGRLPSNVKCYFLPLIIR